MWENKPNQPKPNDNNNKIKPRKRIRLAGAQSNIWDDNVCNILFWVFTFDVGVRICCAAMRLVCRRHFSTHGIDAVNWFFDLFGCRHDIRRSVCASVSIAFVAVTHCCRRPSAVVFDFFAIYLDACRQSPDYYGNMCSCPYFYRSLCPSLPVSIRYQ